MTVQTLVARLAGPLQAWGSETRFNTVSTHPTPTWSGLLGLCRAALGHGRDADLGDVDWLFELPMAVRVDRAGQRRFDYHTINPLPNAYLRFEGISSNRDLAVVTTGARGKTPSAWMMPKDPDPPTKVTRREYLHDAAFTWFLSGEESNLATLARALVRPVWALSLGRKACTPTAPLVHGLFSGSIEEAAQSVPLLGLDNGRAEPEKVELVWLNRFPGDGNAATQRMLTDRPLGAHPFDGYASHAHRVVRLDLLPKSCGWEESLTWAEANLSQPFEEEE